MALCRLYLFTYRRTHLLPRAIESILAQSMKDFICEVHNDDPADRTPAAIVARHADKRLVMVDHPENLGPVRSYNLAFRPVAERYVSMLQDDNWWEPEFLERMIAELERQPGLSIATCSQKLWNEEADGSWTDTGRTASATRQDRTLIYWPRRHHVLGSVYADGSTVYRSEGIDRYQVPEDTLFDMVELHRERCFPFPTLYIGRPLANFAVTRQTARSSDVHRYACAQVLAAGSFFRNFHPARESLAELLAEESAKRPRRTNSLILAALLYPGCRYLFRYMGPSDFTYFLATCVKHPGVILRTIRDIICSGGLRRFLNDRTAERAREAFRGHIDDFVDA